MVAALRTGIDAAAVVSRVTPRQAPFATWRALGGVADPGGGEDAALGAAVSAATCKVLVPSLMRNLSVYGASYAKDARFVPVFLVYREFWLLSSYTPNDPLSMVKPGLAIFASDRWFQPRGRANG
jgi:hypothetical protein